MAESVTFTLDAKSTKAVRAWEQLIKAQKGSEEGFKKQVKGAGKLESSLKTLATRIIGPAALVGAFASLDAIAKKYLNTMKEINTVSEAVTKGAVSFLALQPKGTLAPRQAQVRALAVGAGVKPSEEVFRLQQAMQSAIGVAQPGLTDAQSFRKGLITTGAILRATHLGITLPQAEAAEATGITLGAKPGQTLLDLYVAGKVSAKDPTVLIPAAGGMASFKGVGPGGMRSAAAIAAGIAGVEGTRTRESLMRIGRALSVAGPLQPFFKRRGMGGVADPMERLRVLYEAGLTTTAGLVNAGLPPEASEVLSIATQAYPGIKGIRAKVAAQAMPGLFTSERARIEAEIPMQGLNRQLDFGRAKYVDLTAFGPVAMRAKEAEILGTARAIALKRLGLDINLLGGSRIEGGAERPTATFGDVLRAGIISEALPYGVGIDDVRARATPDATDPILPSAGGILGLIRREVRLIVNEMQGAVRANKDLRRDAE